MFMKIVMVVMVFYLLVSVLALFGAHIFAEILFTPIAFLVVLGYAYISAIAAKW